MGATRRNFQAQPKILKKLLEHQIYQSERKFSQKNYVSFLKSVKEPKILIGATRRNLQAQPKILKKIIGTPNQPKETKILLFTLKYFELKWLGAGKKYIVKRKHSKWRLQNFRKAYSSKKKFRCIFRLNFFF
jgi:hypothetical protein